MSVVAVLMLLWDRYVSDGTFTMWQAPALLLGVVLLAWAWVNYLRLDGVTIHHLGEEFKDMGKKKKFHSTKSIVDFADERIVSFEELEPEERIYCSMLSNLLLGGRCSSSASSQAQCEGSGHGRKKRKQLVVGILAHVDSGKTTLSEAMLYRAGSIRKLGRVDNKDAFLDTDTLEKARGITIFSKQAC